MRKRAAEKLQRRPEDLDYAAGRFHVRDASGPAIILAELMQALQSTGRLDTAGKITIVDRSPMLLGQFSSKAHDYALGKLTEVGADVKLAVGVTAVHPDRVEFDDHTTIPARTAPLTASHSGSVEHASVTGWPSDRLMTRML